MGTWHDIESARDSDWSDAPDDDDVLEELLEIAQDAVVRYMPRVERLAYEEALDAEDPWDVPARLRKAQLMHAKNIYTSDVVDTGGGIGDGEFQIKPHPLDWHVKQLIRPRRAVPRVR